MKPPSGNKTLVIGVMSGTSLDGIDLAAVEFRQENGRWNFSVISAQTVAYSDAWQEKLQKAPTLSGEALNELHAEYGRFTGKAVSRFIKSARVSPALIASHGHTIFHQPDKGFSFQAGSGAAIAAETGLPTVADFRSGDVALGGQGAPLVPVGDRLLFSAYDYCLNLGGFANISYEKNGQRVAYDICPANFILNHLARKMQLPYDKNGDIGRCGKTDPRLLEQLNQLDYYQKAPPKSLGREWMEFAFLPLIENADLSNKDKLRTVYEHMAIQMAKACPGPEKMLVTGGGAFNTFLMERIKKYSPATIAVPDKKIIDYKEALIFAFLGLLRYRGQVNCYASVSGASRDSSTGAVFLP